MKSFEDSVTFLINTGVQSGIAVDTIMNTIHYEMLLDGCSVLVAKLELFPA
jgi:hypothetical protein